MCDTQRRNFIAGSIALTALATVKATEALASQATSSQNKVWVCPPCGCPDDTTEFQARGRCPSCDMELVEKTKSGPKSTGSDDQANNAVPSPPIR